MPSIRTGSFFLIGAILATFACGGSEVSEVAPTPDAGGVAPRPCIVTIESGLSHQVFCDVLVESDGASTSIWISTRALFTPEFAFNLTLDGVPRAISYGASDSQQSGRIEEGVTNDYLLDTNANRGEATVELTSVEPPLPMHGGAGWTVHGNLHARYLGTGLAIDATISATVSF